MKSYVLRSASGELKATLSATVAFACLNGSVGSYLPYKVEGKPPASQYVFDSDSTVTVGQGDINVVLNLWKGDKIVITDK